MGAPLSLSFEDQEVTEASERFLESVAGDGSAEVLRFVNAYSLACADANPSYLEVLRGPGRNFADGRPLAAFLSLSVGGSLRSRHVPGPAFFETCLDRGRRWGTRHFLLGGTQELLDVLHAAINTKYPGVEVVGTFAPPFRPMTEEERDGQDQLIKASGADVVWVALGTPKQDTEAVRIWRKTGLNVAAVGAAFDFLAGTTRRSPSWISTLGLEWVFRLSKEPRRLWRRYLFGNVRFLVVLGRSVLRSEP